MNAIKWILGGAISIVLGLFLTAALQEPINDMFRSDRITAELVLSPWHAKPSPSADKAAPDSKETSTDTVAEIINELQSLAADMGSTDRSHLGRLTMENKSEKVISNIKVRFGETRFDALLDLEGDDKDVFSKDLNEIKVPDMRPGDKIVFYIWANLYGDPKYFVEDIDTFSSTGEFRMKFSWPEVREEDDGALDEFLDEWMTAIIIVVLLIVCAVLWIVAALYEEHVKKLLSDSAFYATRKSKFDANPKAYNAFDADTPAAQ